MGSSRNADTKKARFTALVQQRQPAILDEAFAAEARRVIGPVSNSWLHHLFRSTGLPMTPVVEGVSLASVPELRRTLGALARLYVASDTPAGRKAIRAVVLEAMTPARTLARRPTDERKRMERAEMLLEIHTWLENPLVFDLWMELKSTR